MPLDPPIYALAFGPSSLHPSTFYFLPTPLGDIGAIFLVMHTIIRHVNCTRFVNQTIPFCSTGCIASPAHRREGLATLAQFLGYSPEYWDDQ